MVFNPKIKSIFTVKIKLLLYRKCMILPKITDFILNNSHLHVDLLLNIQTHTLLIIEILQLNIIFGEKTLI